MDAIRKIHKKISKNNEEVKNVKKSSDCRNSGPTP